MDQTLQHGKVIFAGAGPGDPELITVRAARSLQQAEIVLVDRLVSPVIIHEYVSKDATVISVGKQAGKDGSVPQKKINELLVKYALEGRRIVRLKGGDVSVFSNILDELEALVEHKISYEIIPGVTAGLGAAAYAGIPLTARGYANAVRFLTFYREEILGEKEWLELATTTDTLVFYMASKKLSGLIHHLKNHGIKPEMPVAIIEQATTAFQKITFSNIDTINSDRKDKELVSPALLIIGKVVELHKNFAWFTTIEADINYFNPVGSASTADISLQQGSQKNRSHVAGL